jgi:hypothetical protein
MAASSGGGSRLDKLVGLLEGALETALSASNHVRFPSGAHADHVAMAQLDPALERGVLPETRLLPSSQATPRSCRTSSARCCSHSLSAAPCGVSH